MQGADPMPRIRLILEDDEGNPLSDEPFGGEGEEEEGAFQSYVEKHPTGGMARKSRTFWPCRRGVRPYYAAAASACGLTRASASCVSSRSVSISSSSVCWSSSPASS